MATTFKNFLRRMERHPHRHDFLTHIEFADGACLSVQAAGHAYSIPRKVCKVGDYTHMEVGYKPGPFLSYLPLGCPHRDAAEEGRCPVYPYMPVGDIQEVFEFLEEFHGQAIIPFSTG